VDICFVEVDLVAALPMVVEVGALGRPVVGVVLEPRLPRKDIGDKAIEMEALLRVQLKQR
jgi:hypothetical protein